MQSLSFSIRERREWREGLAMCMLPAPLHPSPASLSSASAPYPEETGGQGHGPNTESLRATQMDRDSGRKSMQSHTFHAGPGRGLLPVKDS